MKYSLLLVLCVAAVQGFAQQMLNNVIVKSKMEMTTDAPAGGGDGPGFAMANNETIIKTFIRDSMRKVVVENNFMNSITIYDGNKGVTTTLTESMGEKTGYTQTREEIADQRRRTDSIIKAREAEGPAPGGGMVVRIGGGAGNVTGIQYTDEAKVINKINCKKAVVTVKKTDGSEQKIDVWYSPDYKLPITGGGRGMLNLGEIKGLPVMYETTNTMNIGGNEMTMTNHFEITSLEVDAKIADKEFEIPKGYKIKTYQEYLKDNPDGMPGMRRTIRIGG